VKTQKVILVGTMDTKSDEFLFVKDILASSGVEAVTIDIGLKGKPGFEPDYTREMVVESSGVGMEDFISSDKQRAIEIMTRGAIRIIGDWVKEGEAGGILSLGGSNGTYMASVIMKKLPFGMPKIIVSTMASGDTKPYIGHSDIIMVNSVTDIAGLNRFLKETLQNAALSMAGMVKGRQAGVLSKKPMIAATMMGVTTPCVTEAKKYLEEKGYEVVVFHANGNGGMAMEEMILKDEFIGVLDMTTVEVVNEIVGGPFAECHGRLTGAVKKGIPQVVSTGAMDILVFGERSTLPEKYANRNIVMHNSAITLVRTNEQENTLAGRNVAEKLNRSVPGETTVLIPQKGFSAMDVEGEPFYGLAEDRSMIRELRENLDPNKVGLIESPYDINNPIFARMAANLLHKKIVAKILKK
jgi:uncharacterized protein (UPF0261 family)